MNKLDKKFVNEVLESFKEYHKIDESQETSISVMLAKISAEIFAMSFNKLIKENYFHESQNDTSE